MAKNKPNQIIASKYSEYSAFLQSIKHIESPIYVCDEKDNHKSSLYYEKELLCDFPFGNSRLNIEVRNADPGNFSAQILSDAIVQQVLFRYDTGGGTHRNNFDGIPLDKQSVTTPHFHCYNSDGYFMAYKTSEMANEEIESKLEDIDYGFPLFCEQGHIINDKTKLVPEIKVGSVDTLPFAHEDYDPNEGIEF